VKYLNDENGNTIANLEQLLYKNSWLDFECLSIGCPVWRANLWVHNCFLSWHNYGYILLFTL